MHHVTIERARELLGRQADSLPDSQLDNALDSLHTIAQIIVREARHQAGRHILPRIQPGTGPRHQPVTAGA
jgi:hypothetical protein